VDLTPQVDPSRIAAAARMIVSGSDVAGVLAVNVGLDMPDFAEGLVEAARSAGKPLLACVVDAPGVAARMQAAAVPVYPMPERAVRAYRALWLAGRGPAGDAPASLCPVLRIELASILDSAHGAMPYDLARELLSAYGLRFCREAVANGAAAALEAASRMGFPVVLKTARADVLHKSETGAVVMDVRHPAALREACESVAGRAGSDAFIVQAQVARGTELLVGGRRDDSFGPVVAVGMGGFLAEAVRDVSLALAPLSLEEACELVPQGLRGRLMAGYRGLPAWEAAPAARALVAVGRALADHSRIREIDVNPLIVRGAEAVAVDALVILD
jgi:acetyltransferase